MLSRQFARRLSSVQHEYTVVGEHTAESTIKRSRFVAHCTSASHFDDAKLFIDKVSDYSKARHNCWGWVGRNTQRSNDDGEPSGTAGRPILNAITSENLVDVVVVVTRYKTSQAPLLGAGGLIRAYGGTAGLVVKEMERIPIVPMLSMLITYPLNKSGKIQSIIGKYESNSLGNGSLRKRQENYSVDGVSVTMNVSVEENYKDMLVSELILGNNDDDITTTLITDDGMEEQHENENNHSNNI
jgi:putative IMPACT (imprinted ancient) family translation regulator